MAERDEGFEGVDKPVVAGTGDDVALALAAIDALGKDDPPTGTDVPESEQSTAAPEGRTDDTPKTAPSGGKDAVSDTVEPQGVLAADGKNIIPYDVLRTTRERADTEAQARAAAEAAAQSAKDQLAATQAELEQLRAGNAAPGADKGAARAGSSERIAQLKAQADAVRDELPAMAGALDGLVEELEAVAALRTTLEEREASDKTQRERGEQDAAAQAQAAVRTAIDSNPTLAFWESHQDPAAYNRAVDFDEVLRKDPAWAGKSMGERFTKAVELTLAVMPGAPKPPVTPTAAEIQVRAEKAVRDAGDFTPNTLSDLPAGASPGADPLENIANSDVIQLGRRMDQMSPAQVEELLSRIG